MALRSQVPKFGDWENQGDVPYTVYFEKAKKGRKGKTNQQFQGEAGNNYGELTKAEPQRPKVQGSLKTKQQFQGEAEKNYGELTKSELEKPKVQGSLKAKHEPVVAREEVDLKKSTDSPAQPRRMSRPSAGSVQSFDNSPVHARHQARSGNRASVSSDGSSYGAGSSTPGRTRLGHGGTRADENADDGPAIPKFGDWDENDPASGERYTEVFNKARNDKHAGGKSPMITSDNNDFFGQRNEKSTGCSCIPWRRK